MRGKNSLASLLNAHMKRASLGDARLASLANSIADDPSFIHRSTIRNWRQSSSQKVSNWRQLAIVAMALRLDKDEANRLLETGGSPQLDILASTGNESDLKLLNYWPSCSNSQSSPAQDEKAVSISQISDTSNEIEPSDASLKVHHSSNRGESKFPKKTNRWRSASLLVAAMGIFLLLGYLIIQSNSPVSNKAENLVQNSSFSNGTKNWKSYVNDAADADFKIDDESLHITINATGRKSWHIQVFQPGFDIVRGEIYTLRFRVRGDTGTSFKSDVVRNVDPKTSLGLEDAVRQLIPVTQKWSIKTIQFQANESMRLTNGGARVLFDIGKSNSGSIYLDDVELYHGRY